MAASVRFMDPTGVTSITLDQLADAIAGQNQTPQKLGFHSTSSRNLINVLISIGVIPSNDGASQLRDVLDSSSALPTLSCPWGFAAAVVANAGTFSGTGTYGYRITSTNSTGESGAQDEITAVVTATTQNVNLSWTQVPGATGYKIYRTPTPGTYGVSTLLATIGSGATVSYTDTGTATTSGTIPTTNTTGGWKLNAVLSGAGAGGTWGATGVYFWSVVGYDSTGVQLDQTLEVSVNVDVTTKKVTLSWVNDPNANTYSIFRTQVSGSYTSPALVVAGLAAGTTSHDDTGTAVLSGGLTTGPSYGIPPSAGSFGTTALVAGSSIAPGQEVYFWINRVVPAGTPEIGNPRQANIVVSES